MSFQLPWSGAFRLQSYVNRTPDALEASAIAAIRSAILDSPLLGETNLSGQFSGTYGFSVTFRREALSQVADRFPAFAPFLDAAVLPDCDAFLLNPLLIQNGKGVAAHIDRSLAFYGEAIGCPVAVSVLYVQVPEPLAGGELRLYHRGRHVAGVTPQTGALVTFRGDLTHEVVAVESGAPEIAEARISLVVEQYRVPPALRDAVPAFELRTRSGALV